MAANAEQEQMTQLQARVVQLEDELVEQAARTNAVLADAQRRLYWLDRLQLDLDVTLARPPIRFTLLAALGAVRRARRLRGRVRRLVHR